MKITERRLHVEQGQEGSWHDPWSTEKIIVWLNGRKITLCIYGLSGVWVELNGKKLKDTHYPHVQNAEIPFKMWEALAGMTESDFWRAWERNYYSHHWDPLGPASSYE